MIRYFINMEFEFNFPSTVFDVVKSGIDIDFSDLFNKKAIRRQLRIFLDCISVVSEQAETKIYRPHYPFSQQQNFIRDHQ